MKMKTRLLEYALLSLLITAPGHYAIASNEIDAVMLVYQEVEQGVDPYVVNYIITDSHIRIEDTSDESGYIIYDIKHNRIRSVSHFDKTILLIPEYERVSYVPDYKLDIEYKLMDDAPKISGKSVYSYRVSAIKDNKSQLCMDIQLVPGLLPDEASSLQKFQALVSGQHALNLNKTPEEFLTPCYLTGLVFNEGDYYKKGLPIQEWHSNEKKRILIDYRAVKVAADIFETPIDYREYSIN